MSGQNDFSGRRPRRVSGAQMLIHALLLIAAFITLMPFYWMILTALRPMQEVFSATFQWLPRHFAGWENFRTALSRAPLLHYMANGIIVCAGILAVQLFTSIPCAWALARYRFRGQKALFMAVLMGLTVPVQAPAIPLFIGLSRLGLLDTYLALMLPFFLSVFAIFLFRQSFKTFPEDIVHAARLDGMSEWAILWRVVVPSLKPALAAFTVFSVVAHWNDLYWPLIVVTSPEMATPPLGMARFADPETGTNFGALMAAATLLTLPVMLLFLAMQRQFMRGVTSTGIK